jgi:preprotein translocase subunit SecG
MNLLLNLVVALQILAALVMIGLVLIQHGKGADMGASFGSGASGSLFGAAVFFVCTLALAFISNDRSPRGGGTSVLDRPASSAPAPSVPATGAALVPGAASAGASAAPAAPVTPASGAGAVPTK